MQLKAQIDEIIFDSSDHEEQLTRLENLADTHAINFVKWFLIETKKDPLGVTLDLEKFNLPLSLKTYKIRVHTRGY